MMIDQANLCIEQTKDVSIKKFKDLMEWYGDDAKSTEEQRMYCVYEMFTPFILSSMTKDMIGQFRLEYISFPEIHRTNKVKGVN